MATFCVTIPTLNEQDYIGLCLDSLLAQNVLPDEIIVVDNGSTDQTIQRVQAYQARLPQLRLLHESRRGCHMARDTSWRGATSDWIVQIDADETLPDGWYASVVALCAAHPTIDVFSGTYRFPDPPLSVFALQVLYNRLYPGLLKLVKGFPYLTGGMIIVRRKVLEQLDGYRGKPDNMLEDYYLSEAAYKAGFKLLYTHHLYGWHSLRRYEQGGLRGFLKWGTGLIDANHYEAR